MLKKINVMLENPKTVLLVDHQPDEIVYFHKAIGNRRFCCSVNKTGAGAIKSITENASDVVLLDRLLAMNGIDVV
jgi:DNA-binding response OmpR family regulator